MNMKIDYKEPIEVADNIFWLGFPDFEAGFSNNPYLLYERNESVLFDPGPGHPLFRDILLQKIEKICKLTDIRYIIVHHSDPDLCGAIPYVENHFHPGLLILSHSRTNLFLPYYGIRKPLVSIEDGDTLLLNQKRKIQFVHTPYVHFVGSIMSYDEQTESLFSSDIFAVLEKDWKLHATKDYLIKAKNFLESYVEGKESIMYTYQAFKKLKIKRILPQHGSIIPEELVNDFIELLPQIEPGKVLVNKNLQEDVVNTSLIEEIKDYYFSLINETKNQKHFLDLKEILDDAGAKGITVLLSIVDFILDLEKKTGRRILNKEQRILDYHILSKKSFSTENAILRKMIQIQMPENTNGEVELEKTIELKSLSVNSYKEEFIILFFDIRNFTLWSQQKNPDEIFFTLNKEMSIVSEIIKKMGGRINKVIGDGILAYYPSNLADSAFRTTIKIHTVLHKEKLLPAAIAITSGEVAIGDIGTDEKIDYTLIGSPVNYASRLNDLALKGETAMSLSFFEKLNDKNKNVVLTNPFLLKGEFKEKNSEELIHYYKIKVIKYN